jgi:predicted Rossmann fold nucleotide-binding protein DprA/Smf involved in DNA uptake
LAKQKELSSVAVRIDRGDSLYPAILIARLADRAPPGITAIGPVALLAHRKTAIFCSAPAPADVLSHARHAALCMCEQGVTVISGFHSPVENECLRILLEGKQPIILCPARAIGTMRIPDDCRAAFEAGRLLFLSPFAGPPRRADRDSATKRNEFVAALADEAYVPHVSPGGLTARIAEMLAEWKVPLRTFS